MIACLHCKVCHSLDLVRLTHRQHILLTLSCPTFSYPYTAVVPFESRERDLFVVVVRHLQASPLEATLDVESFVGVAAVKDGLVAADLVGDEVESLDQPKTQLLALLVFCDGDVLDVTNHAEVMDASSRHVVSTGKRRPARVPQWVAGPLKRPQPNSNKRKGGGGPPMRRLEWIWWGEGRGGNLQFPLGDQGARANDPPGILDDKHVVAPILLADPLEALGELGLANVANSGEDTQALEEASVVVGLAQGAQLVARWQGGDDLAGDQVVAEEVCFCGCVHGLGRGIGGCLGGSCRAGRSGFGLCCAVHDVCGWNGKSW